MATRIKEQPEYYTVEEAMKLLRLSRATLYARINSGEIKSRKLGRKRLIPWWEIRASREDKQER